ncbi:MAG: SDR family NAD(P)-dependent oxidoreductase [Alcaligenes sp.]
MTDAFAVHDSVGIDVAIVGMAGRFPGANNVDELWRNITGGMESLATFTDEQLRERGVTQAMLDDPAYVKAGIQFDGFDQFDAAFFGYSPREAEQLDPQHRLFLECAWEAIESAGYDVSRIDFPVGIYGGAGPNLYLMRHLLPRLDWERGSGIAELMSLMNGNAMGALCTQVAYKLNLRGPAVTVHTACSTSLAAVHIACQSLLGQECDMALAGGVWLNLLQDKGYLHQVGAILSSDGHCRAFDAMADGTSLGSGVGIVVLKRLDDAVRDSDVIHAVIKGTAMNNDGTDKVGYTAPSVQAQAEVIEAAQLVAGVDAETIGYVEAHGTGTTLGDPIEVAALTQAFRGSTNRSGYCALGSLKTNIGHLDAAAGVAGLIKTTLALRNAVLPPSLHFSTPNPEIDFESSPFYVNTELKAWPSADAPRRAGVSSFGIGGTNVHVVLEEAPLYSISQELEIRGDPWFVLPLSAASEAALTASVAQLSAHLQAHPEIAIGDVAHTLQVGRQAMPVRAMVAANSCEEAVRALSNVPLSVGWAKAVSDARPDVVFVFPGAGSQHARMGEELYRGYTVFRSAVDECLTNLRQEFDIDLSPHLFPSSGEEEKANRALARMEFGQPALFAISYAMAQLWMSMGVVPKMMLGHSLGEYVAACVSGVFSLEDALRVVVGRARLQERQGPGAMTSVLLSESELQPYLNDGCEIAAINGEQLVVISGTVEGVEAVESELTANGHVPRRLHVAVAAHSVMTEPFMAELEALVASVPRKAPSVPFISNVTGKLITSDQALDPAYWAQHLRSTVRFSEGMDAILASPGQIVLEVGPSDALTGTIRQSPKAESAAVIVASQAHARQYEQNGQRFAAAIGTLWSFGVDTNWDAVVDHSESRRVPLPTYPFVHRSYWRPVADGRAVCDSGTHGRQPVDEWFYTPVWRRVEPLARSTGQSLGCSLLLRDGSRISDALEAWLSQQGGPVVSVSTGPSFARLGVRHFQVRRAQKDDLVQLLDVARQEFGPPARICHVLGEELLEPGAALEVGLFTVMALAQALNDASCQTDKHKITIAVVATGLDDVVGGETVCPEKATLLGFFKVWQQEMPALRCRLIDVTTQTDSTERLGKVIAQIGAELLADDGDSLVAYRGGHRWLKRYESVARPKVDSQCLREEGVYLITGGLGGVGATFARYLAQHVKAKLVLLTHSAFPERGQWQEVLSADAANDAMRLRVEHVMGLESLGADVEVIQADVNDAGQLRQAVELAGQRFGDLNGVIHAAGRAGGGLIALRSREEAENVLAPKLHGTRNLFAVLEGQPLDFMVLCSSLTAVVGGFGQADYAAANSAMDAIGGQADLDQPWPVISVNWDVWRDLGMAVGQQLPDGLGIDAVQGGELLERILAGPASPQLLVSTLKLDRQVEYVQSADLADRLTITADLKPTGQPRPKLDVDYIEPTDEMERQLVQIWSDLLGVMPIGVKDNLFELGGNSLVAVQILSRVRAEFRISVSPSEFFRRLTVDALAELLRAEVGRQGTASNAEIELVPTTRDGVLRPAPMQKRIWVFDRLSDGNTLARAAYNETLAISLSGSLNEPLLLDAVRQIVIRHEVLRTTYPEDEQGEPIVVITSDARVPFSLVDLVDRPEKDALQEYQAAYEAMVEEPFDLAAGPLLRGRLVRFAHDRHILIMAIHHIVFDGWSISIFADELCESYQSLLEKRPMRHAQLSLQYADYANWHERKLAMRAEEVASFWRAQLNGAPLQTTVPHDLLRPKAMKHLGRSFRFPLEPTISGKARTIANTLEISLFTLLFGAFLLVLHRRIDQQDVVVGTDVAGRDHAELERLIGFFVNVVPVRSRISGNDLPLRQWLARLQENVSRVFDHQALPFDQITRLAAAPGRRVGSPLVQILFVMQNTPQRQFELDGLKVDVLPQSVRSSKFDMAVFIHEKGPSLSVEWVYATELYRDDTAKAISEAWVEAVNVICENPNISIGQITGPTDSGTPTMNNILTKSSKLEKFATLGKRPFVAASDQDVRISFPSAQRQFPVMIEATDRDVDPAWWAKRNRDFIEEKLRTHAGIVFRNFGLETPQDFERFTVAMEPHLYGSYGDLPKKEGGVNTYRSTPYPEQQMILYHNESSHTDRWPRKQWFFCELPSRVGGITPIVDCREMLEYLPAEVVSEFEAKGLLYVRSFHPKLDVSWQHFFKTDDRGEVEDRLSSSGIDWEWFDGDILQTRTKAPAIITHPVTGERVFFNQVQLHQVSCLEREVRENLLSMVGLKLMPRNVYFGDGSSIPDALMETIGIGYEACAVRLKWIRGDVVMLDNMLAAHARDPYEGPRKIVVAMGDMYERDTEGAMRRIALRESRVSEE